MANFPIVGIGSSAGGLEPLRQLFRAMPADSGLAFIVAAHLDPTRKSHLTELLAQCTKMPVVQIEEPIEVAPDHVYVIGPDQELTIRQGLVQPNKPQAPRGHRHPVDVFFRSLAEDQGDCAIGIVLSGTGTNGTLGLRFIKAEGGIVIAQSPDSAGFEGMPQSAIDTGIVDLVLPPDQMPEALVSLARHSYVRQPARSIEEATPADQLKTLLALVRARTRLDFNSYRKPTLLRRIHRRMGLHRIDELSSYIERLRNDPHEVKALAADLTINVTGFLRDPEAWSTLAAKVIAPLVRDRPADSAIRVWVPGCSTGEEAYTIAMLVAEQAQATGKLFNLKIFATDVADGVLSSARAGTYPGSIALDLGEERLERFFTKHDDTYAISPALREMITFAPQNLLQDPPFSRLDLISCRNLLIYLEPELQKRLLGLFHFALREGGHLFLGSAESVSAQEELFQPVSKKWRIYRRLGPTRHDLMDFPLVEIGNLVAGGQTNLTTGAAGRSAHPGDLMDQALLERYAPASALIDPGCRVHYLRGPTDDYLRPPSGEPSYSLLAMAREGLQAPLRRAIRQAVDQSREVELDARVRRGGVLHPVRIVVAPLRSTGAAEGRLLVGFFERPVTVGGDASAEAAEASSDGHLQAELDTAREDLRLSVEQMEASNEELETSKEELQSLNEELNTVNNQLQAKVGELENRTDELNNPLNGTDLATLFLDRHLCIRWFTPAMKALLELRPADIGRPISHFVQRFEGGDLLEDARQVLARLVISDGEVVDDLGRWYIRRILPYRTTNDRIDGVVVTFAEITERKRREQQVQDARDFAEHVIEAVRFPLVVLTPEQRVRRVNEAFCQTFEVSRDETEGQLLALLGNRQWDVPELHRLLSRVLPERKELLDFEITHDFERIGRRTVLLHARPLDGERLVLLGMVDLTARRRDEEEKELLVGELSHRVKNTLAVVQSLAMHTDGRNRSVEEYRDAFVGRLQALARAHSMLLDAHWRSADLGHLVDLAVAAYRVDHPEVVQVEGEPVTITAKQGLGLSLILHELGTNAAKYGALTRSEGRLHVSWQIEEGDSRYVRLKWQERHGPAVVPPAKKGFGTRLIEGASSYDLEGTTELEYAPGGLSFELVFPLA